MDHFAKLPGDCISEIISFTSPVDASVFSVISKRFKSASESDTVWNKFLPSDIQDLISRSSSPLEFPTKRDFYLSLSNSHILLDGGKLSFSLEKKTGKKCFVVAAAELMFTVHDTNRLLGRRKPGIREVAVFTFLDGIFDVCGNISSHLLTQETHYSSFLVYKVISPPEYDIALVTAVCRFAEIESRDVAQGRASPVSLVQQGNGLPVGDFHAYFARRLPRLRPYGRLEVEIGTFFNLGGSRGHIESLVSGVALPDYLVVVVQGIEFRPETIIGCEDSSIFPQDF